MVVRGSRIPFSQSLPLIAVCAALFFGLLISLAVVDRPVKEEREIERRKSVGQTVAPKLYVAVWLYRGLQANLVLAGALLLASPWLGVRRKEGVALLPKTEVAPFGKLKVIACVGLMGVAAWHHAPRLSHGMWGDEEFNASRFMVPEVERQEDGSLEFKERPWVTTLWSMRKPTNHLAYSAAARLSHDTFFEPGSGPQDKFFSEALFRAPVYVAGLLMIPAFLWALRVWGLSGWWALLLLMLHPWYLRFGVDGRAYCFMMLASILLVGSLGRALQTGLWRWWVAIGIGGFFLNWCNLQGLYQLAALHITIGGFLLVGGLSNDARFFLGRRWVVSGVITGMLMLGYLSPCWPQLLEFLEKEEIKGVMDRSYWEEALGGWFFGQPWVTWHQPDNPLRYGMDLSMRWLPGLHWAGIGLFVGLLVAGLGLLVVDRKRWALLGFLVGGPLVMLTHMAVSHSRPYDWYFSPYVPGLLMVLAVGMTWLARRRFGVVALVVTVGLFALVTREPRRLFRDHPVEASRESVASYREVTNPRHPDIEKEVISGAYGMYTEGYDPAMRRFDDMQGLRDLMAEADRSSRRLYVNAGNIAFLRGSEATRDVTLMLEDAALFEPAGTFYGLLPFTTRSVFRYRGGAE
ncbi:hypothetical protein FEM03_06885 [Phragmitibacter flavus]|uniref:Glycosyltransferase RgtA/B/C/D-like domain-containing protein n=1 Tax=Phragmitibacter flavus TaxID=2576071 RepID=A0A5R8KG19_9BACT|nr:hypothetical protein [Phragmitibacter flavus]TLD71254.1 hypothetical protein FEM03_06885 [Phragmitibacter flavus]